MMAVLNKLATTQQESKLGKTDTTAPNNRVGTTTAKAVGLSNAINSIMKTTANIAGGMYREAEKETAEEQKLNTDMAQRIAISKSVELNKVRNELELAVTEGKVTRGDATKQLSDYNVKNILTSEQGLSVEAKDEFDRLYTTPSLKTVNNQSTQWGKEQHAIDEKIYIDAQEQQRVELGGDITRGIINVQKKGLRDKGMNDNDVDILAAKQATNSFITYLNRHPETVDVKNAEEMLIDQHYGGFVGKDKDGKLVWKTDDVRVKEEITSKLEWFRATRVKILDARAKANTDAIYAKLESAVKPIRFADSEKTITELVKQLPPEKRAEALEKYGEKWEDGYAKGFGEVKIAVAKARQDPFGYEAVGKKAKEYTDNISKGNITNAVKTYFLSEDPIQREKALSNLTRASSHNIQNNHMAKQVIEAYLSSPDVMKNVQQKPELFKNKEIFSSMVEAATGEDKSKLLLLGALSTTGAINISDEELNKMYGKHLTKEERADLSITDDELSVIDTITDTAVRKAYTDTIQGLKYAGLSKLSNNVLSSVSSMYTTVQSNTEYDKGTKFHKNHRGNVKADTTVTLSKGAMNHVRNIPSLNNSPEKLVGDISRYLIERDIVITHNEEVHVDMEEGTDVGVITLNGGTEKNPSFIPVGKIWFSKDRYYMNAYIK